MTRVTDRPPLKFPNYDLAEESTRLARMRSLGNPARLVSFSSLAALALVTSAAGAAPMPATAAASPSSSSDAPASAPASVSTNVQPSVSPSPQMIQASQAEAKKLSDAFVAVAEKVSPSVVQIEVTSHDENPDDVLRWIGHGGRGDTPIAHSTGAGVIFTDGGAILTNNHVVDGALSINVHLRDGRFLPARLVGRDPSTDLAVVQIDAKGLTPAKFADSDAARVGEWSVAIGSPLGLGYTVTAGILSAKGRTGLGMNAIEDFLQTDASINPGNSGGPLCDLNGNVLGINAMIAGGHATGIGFAIPSNMAQRVAQQLMKTGHVERAWLGVGIQDMTPELASMMKLEPGSGALVNTVGDGGPAAKSNMKPGDVIAAVAGRAVHDGPELMREVGRHDVGQTVNLEIVRSGKHYSTAVVLTARPEPEVPPLPVQQQNVPHAGLGLTVRDIGAPQAQAMGLPPKAATLVTGVLPGSAADRAAIKPGDVIVEADGTENPTSAQLQAAAQDGELLLRLKRQNHAFYAGLRK